jgi:hypothetical protein
MDKSNSPLQVTEHKGEGAAVELQSRFAGCNIDKKLVKVWLHYLE